jgi:hypothetical protein
MLQYHNKIMENSIISKFTNKLFFWKKKKLFVMSVRKLTLGYGILGVLCGYTIYSYIKYMLMFKEFDNSQNISIFYQYEIMVVLF